MTNLRFWTTYSACFYACTDPMYDPLPVHHDTFACVLVPKKIQLADSS